MTTCFIPDSVWPRFRAGTDRLAFCNALLDVLDPHLQVFFSRTSTSYVIDDTPSTREIPLPRSLAQDILGPLDWVQVIHWRDAGLLRNTRVVASQDGVVQLWRLVATTSYVGYALRTNADTILGWLRTVPLPPRTVVRLPTTQHAWLRWRAQDPTGHQLLQQLMAQQGRLLQNVCLFRDGPVTALVETGNNPLPIVWHV